jgi:trehalose 6-phosphate synthase
VIINPYDASAMGEAIARALTMPEEEQRQRMRRMREIVRDNNVYRWAGSMLQDAARLRKRSEIQEATAQPLPEPPRFADNVVRMFDRPRAMARDKSSMARTSTAPPAE